MVSGVVYFVPRQMDIDVCAPHKLGCIKLYNFQQVDVNDFSTSDNFDSSKGTAIFD